LPRHYHGSEDPLFAAPIRGILKAGSENCDEFQCEFLQLPVIQPHTLQAITDSVAKQIDVASIEISVEITDESGDIGQEHLPVLIRGHVGKLVCAHRRRARVEYVGTFDCAPNSALAHDAQYTGVDESSDMAIEAARRDVRKFVLKLGGRELAIPEECLEYPQANGV
jgi:hypothetical protein